jgi:hypothetical protein
MVKGPHTLLKMEVLQKESPNLSTSFVIIASYSTTHLCHVNRHRVSTSLLHILRSNHNNHTLLLYYYWLTKRNKVSTSLPLS